MESATHILMQGRSNLFHLNLIMRLKISFQLNKMVLTVLYKMKIVCISIYGEKVVAVR